MLLVAALDNLQATMNGSLPHVHLLTALMTFLPLSSALQALFVSTKFTSTTLSPQAEAGLGPGLSPGWGEINPTGMCYSHLARHGSAILRVTWRMAEEGGNYVGWSERKDQRHMQGYRRRLG